MNKETETLLKYIQNPSPSTCLALYRPDPRPLEKTSSPSGEGGSGCRIPQIKGKALVSWMKKTMAGKGKTLSEDAAEYLVEVVGTIFISLRMPWRKFI